MSRAVAEFEMVVTQLIANGLIDASICALVGLGFGLIYCVTGFFHFAHGAVFTVGAYSLFVFARYLGIPLYASVPGAVGVCALTGCALDAFVYRQLRRREASPLVLLLAALGVYVVLENGISMVFGDDTRMVRSGVVQEGINMLGARVTPVQLLAIAASFTVLVAVAVWLRRTSFGRAVRVVSNDPLLAAVVGLRVDSVILGTFALGSALAGLAGILYSLDLDMRPTMGMHALLIAVVAVLIGGASNVRGIALGALLLGMSRQLGAWALGAEWQDPVTFAILFTFLILKPEGFVGVPSREVSV